MIELPTYKTGDVVMFYAPQYERRPLRKEDKTEAYFGKVKSGVLRLEEDNYKWDYEIEMTWGNMSCNEERIIQKL